MKYFCALIIVFTLLRTSNLYCHNYIPVSDSTTLKSAVSRPIAPVRSKKITFLYPKRNQYIPIGKVLIVWDILNPDTTDKETYWDLEWTPDFGETWRFIDSVNLDNKIHEWQRNLLPLKPDYIKLRLVNKTDRNINYESDVLIAKDHNTDSEFRDTVNAIAMAIGANFSFIDETKINGIYTNIYVSLPKLWNIGVPVFLKRKSPLFLGLDFMLAQGVSTSKDSSKSKPMTSQNLERIENSVENKNVFLSSALTLQFTQGLNAGLCFEVRQSNRRIEAKSSITYLDSNKTLTNITSYSESRFDFFAGYGFIFRNTISDFEIKYSLFVGANLNDDGRSDFIGRFYLKENKSQIKIGGELRGPFFRKGGQTHHELLIYLAKDISIKELFGAFF